MNFLNHSQMISHFHESHGVFKFFGQGLKEKPYPNWAFYKNVGNVLKNKY